MKLHILIKILLGAISAILLGAIGSGVWEKLLSPLFLYLGNKLTELFSKISVTYSDSIYSKASTLDQIGSAKSVTVLILLLLFLGFFILAIKTKKNNRPISILCESFATFFTHGWIGIISIAGYLILILFLQATNNTVQLIRIYSAKNMEIVRPHIGENNYLLLRSEYLQIKNKYDFEKFLLKLNKSASDNSIVIDKPNFE